MEKCSMRTYPANSPEAAARIVAVTLLSDGYVGQTEYEFLSRPGVAMALGLEVERLHGVVHAFCDDLQASSTDPWVEVTRVDARTLARLLGEIDEPALQRRLLRLCHAAVEADGHVAQGESTVLSAAMAQWGLYADVRRPCVDLA
jgi:hypothetical protein